MSEIKKSAKHGNFVIQQAENDSVSIICDNTRQALRDIANEIGMEFDPEWNTRYFGHRLINFINGVDTTRKSKEVEQSNGNTYGVSDEDWEWWVGLSDDMKYVVLSNLMSEFYRKDIGDLIPEFDDVTHKISTDMDLYDRNGVVASLLSEYVVGSYSSEGTFTQGEYNFYSIRSEVTDISDIYKLGHIKQIMGLSFGDWGGGFGEKEIDLILQIPKLQELNLSDNNVDMKALAKLTSLPNLEILQLRRINMNNKVVSEYGIEVLAQLTKLTHLDLQETTIKVQSLAELVSLSHLETLNLKWVEFTGDVQELPIIFSSFSRLNSLDLCQTNLSEDIVAEIQAKLPDCYVSSDY